MKKTYHHGDLESAIIQAALAQIESKGVNSLSLRHVAKGCGVSATAIYRHFHNKEALLAKIGSIGFNALTAYGEKMKPSKVIGVGYVEFALENPGYFEIMFGAHIQDFREYPELEAASNNSYEHLTMHVKQSLQNAFDEKLVNRLVEKKWATIHGLAVLMQKNYIEYTSKNRRKVIEAILSAQIQEHS